MRIFARQGDLVIVEVLDSKVDFSRTNCRLETGAILAGTRSGHHHVVQGEAGVVRSPSGDTEIRVTRATQIVHKKPGGHRPVDLPPGTYRIYPLRERGDNRDVRVED